MATQKGKGVYAKDKKADYKCGVCSRLVNKGEYEPQMKEKKLCAECYALNPQEGVNTETGELLDIPRDAVGQAAWDYLTIKNAITDLKDKLSHQEAILINVMVQHKRTFVKIEDVVVEVDHKLAVDKIKVSKA